MAKKISDSRSKYLVEWKKQHMKYVNFAFKTEFVDEFKQACKTLNVSQSSLVRQLMQDTIDKAKRRG